MHWVIGKRTLVLVVHSEVAHRLASGPLDHGPEAQEKTDNLSCMDERAFVEV